eukprot:TRINITY_DN32415_c0_g1_i1.p2 TRINITY_DN32415_c0_g1~~TRINITY_DN32415_c0_g1_i1.p2  ORF type:complete len:329 (-),score=94.16 TRINITY_DN32415_c0_g1_i1:369-1355(-)
MEAVRSFVFDYLWPFIWKTNVYGALAMATVLAGRSLLGRPKRRSVTDGDTVLVTGCSSGIGWATALHLCDTVGYRVVACVRKTEDVDRLKAATSHPERLVPVLMDITRETHVARTLDFVQNLVGERGLVGLFNNAGIEVTLAPAAMTPISWYRRVMETNYFGQIAVTQAFLPLIRRARGRIVFNTSTFGFFAPPFTSVYASSKFALAGFCDSLRREVSEVGVKVVVVEPGYIKTALGTQDRVDGEKESMLKNAIYRRIPKWVKIEDDSTANGQPAILIAELVEEALRSENPATRYSRGTTSLALRTLRYFPDKFVDFVVYRLMDLQRV